MSTGISKIWTMLVDFIINNRLVTENKFFNQLVYDICQLVLKERINSYFNFFNI